MGTFNKAVVTVKGQALLAKSVAGLCEMQFTRIALSENMLTGELSLLTDIGEIKQSSSITNKEIKDNITVGFEATFVNTELTTGYYTRNIGLYAIDPDEGEILYSISVADESEVMAGWMPPFDGNFVKGLLVEIVTAVSNAPNVSVLVDPNVYATVRQLLDLQDAVKTKVTTPSTGAVGQILEIAGLDEYGKPLSFRAVDKPSGGEGGGVGIESIEQKVTSTESGGINVLEITLTDGTKYYFTVKNGKDGEDLLKEGEGENSAIMCDKENNRAISAYSIAGGDDDSAGFKGYYVMSIDTNNKKIYLSHTSSKPVISTNDNTIEGFETPAYDVRTYKENGDVDYPAYFSINQYWKHPFCSYITAVHDNVIEYGEDFNLPDISTADEAIFWVPDRPNIGSVSFGDSAVSFGESNNASGRGAFCAGRSNIVGGHYGFAAGRLNKVGHACSATGQQNEIFGMYGAVNGVGNKVKGNQQFVSGAYNEVKGEGHTVGGYLNKILRGLYNFVTGHANTLTDANYCEVSGQLHNVTGNSHIVGGHKHTVKGNQHNVSGYSHTVTGTELDTVEGYQHTVTARYSHIDGLLNTVSGDANSVSGQQHNVEGNRHHISGLQHTVKGEGNNVSGQMNEVSGECNSVDGKSNVVSGLYNRVSGTNNQVSGFTNTVCGRGLKTEANCQHIIGQFNLPDATKVFIIGGGTSDTERKNIFTIDKNGVWQSGI